MKNEHSKKNIFIIGLNEFNLGEMESIENAEKYNFIRVFGKKELQEEEDKPDLGKYIREARQQIDAYKGNIDGIIGFFDFPVTLLTFLLCDEYKLRGPSLYCGLKCEHKYWSRLEQRKVIPKHIPGFMAINPFGAPDFDRLEISTPFWLKPVKAFASQLGYHINTKEEYQKSLAEIREGIHLFADPFNDLLSHVDLPEEIAGIDGYHCIAEELISGTQHTLSGYVYNGEIISYGIVDSINYEKAPSFFYYLLPGKLPQNVEDRMANIADKVMMHLGFDNYPFNIEFFYDQDQDQLWLLEINPRMSQSHSDLYAKVKGSSNHEVLVKTVTNENPDFIDRKGKYRVAAKLHYRVFIEDGIIKHAPSEEEIADIKNDFPETLIYVEAIENKKLSELPIQDSYSYRLANIYMGADSEKELLEKYEKIIERLNIDIKKNDDL